MYITVLFRDMLCHCHGTTCGKTFHAKPRSLPRTSTAYHGALTLTLTQLIGTVGIVVPWGLPWSAVWGAVAVAAGIAMVPPMACHVTPHGVPWNPMPRHRMPWGMPWSPWVVLIARQCHGMPRKSKIVYVQRTLCGCRHTRAGVSVQLPNPSSVLLRDVFLLAACM